MPAGAQPLPTHGPHRRRPRWRRPALPLRRPRGTLGRAAAIRRHRQPRDHRVAASALLRADKLSHQRANRQPAARGFSRLAATARAWLPRGRRPSRSDPRAPTRRSPDPCHARQAQEHPITRGQLQARLLPTRHHGGGGGPERMSDRTTHLPEHHITHLPPTRSQPGPSAEVSLGDRGHTVTLHRAHAPPPPPRLTDNKFPQTP